MIATTKFDKNKIKKILTQENDYIVDLLISLNVPDSTDDVDYSNYLLNNKSVTKSTAPQNASVDELEDRLNTIKNKLKTKKKKLSEQSLKKRETKKLKKNKEYKKVLQTAHKTFKNEKVKVETLPDSVKNMAKPIFNAEGKLVFSKFDFAAHPGAKPKKGKKDKVMKNPQQILNKMKEENKKLQELKEQGKEEQIKEQKLDVAWKKAFDKVDGKKIKDDPKLLQKAVNRKKDEKKKKKQKWDERKNKVEQAIENKQKKRTENINKKLKEKKNKKLKKLSKKGRVIAGF